MARNYVCDIEFDPFLPYGEKRWYNREVYVHGFPIKL